jgi:hypothetical protein
VIRCFLTDYRVEHNRLGVLKIFLVPVAAN